MLLAALGSLPALAQDCGATVIFADGFESGDTSAWGGAPSAPYDHVTPADVGVTLGVGVLDPVPTEVYIGSTTIDVPTTIENVVVEGCLRIAADDVTLRNVIIECGGLYPIKVEGGSRDFLIEYSRVQCSSSSKAFYFESGAPDAHVVRNEVIGCEDFFYVQGDLDGVVVADNYLHTLVGGPTSHADGFQIGEASAATGAMHIRGNYIDPDNPEIGRTDVVFGTNFSQVDLLIEDNYFEPWGHYTMRCGGEATHCTIRNNVYGPGFENNLQHLLLANSDSPPSPSEFCCNRYASGGLVEEFYDGQDLVLGAEHWIEGCPSKQARADDQSTTRGTARR